jgi:hypothetical protein
LRKFNECFGEGRDFGFGLEGKGDGGRSLMPIDEGVVQTVWERGRVKSGQDPRMWRQDECGAWLHREQYGNPESEYGWKILSVAPDAQNDVDDMRPFHWSNDFDIANGRPLCEVTADRTELQPWQNVDQPRNTTQ